MRPSPLLQTLPALLLTGAVSFAHAQAPNPASVPVAVGRPGRAPGQAPDQPLGQPPEDRGPQLDFTFHNLPLVEVIHQIQTEYHKASGKHLNVMIPENLRDVAATNRIDVELKQITVPEVLDLLGMASQRPYRLDPIRTSSGQWVGGGTAVTSYIFQRISSNEGALTYLFSGQYPPMTSATAERTVSPVENSPPRTVFFFSLEPFLERNSVEDIITAVKTGWDLDGKKERPTLKYHDETKLLVASGDSSQVEMIQAVLANLGRQGPKARPVPPAAPPAAPGIAPTSPVPGVPPAPAKP
ncbi:MAG: hypothetical protein JNL10_22275 [Verrucomicrobiales bacterium]|nr:hypothetical protein [Verrucomicrobiales bacterium]